MFSAAIVSVLLAPDPIVTLWVAIPVGILGLILTHIDDQKLRVVDYKHKRFWITGCSEEYLLTLRRDLLSPRGNG